MYIYIFMVINTIKNQGYSKHPNHVAIILGSEI